MTEGPRTGSRTLPVTSVLAALVGALLVVVATIALWSNLQARGGVEAMREAATIQASALTFLSRLQDAEAGQRGYILTGDVSFLEPYERAVATVAGDLTRLGTAVGDDEAQGRRVARIGELFGRKLDELARTVALVREDRRDDAVAVVSAAGGKAAMDDIRLMISRILQSEDDAIIAREAELERWNGLSTAAIAAAAIAALVLTLFTLHLIRRQLAVSDTLRARLAGLNQDLEAEVGRRTREAEAARQDAVEQTRRAESERARVELLLQDVNHRVGNNLAMVSGMLGLQISGTRDEEVRAQLKAAQARVSTIANAQRRLRLGADLSTVRADEIVESVIADLRAAVGTEHPIEIETDLSPFLVESRDAVHLAILANEIATNAVKHAFKDRDSGRIVVRLDFDAARMAVLEIEDDGCGMPADGAPGGGLGRKLVSSLSRQFGGTPTIEAGTAGGTRVVIPLPRLEARPA